MRRRQIFAALAAQQSESPGVLPASGVTEPAAGVPSPPPVAVIGPMVEWTPDKPLPDFPMTQQFDEPPALTMQRRKGGRPKGSKNKPKAKH